MKRTPLRRKSPFKKKGTSTLKKKLDAVFSRFVRLTASGDNGECVCFTCGKRLHWKKIQNGHFVSRQYLATRWDLDNCRPQCAGCNIWGRGQTLDFEENLKREIGEARVEELKRMRHQILKLSPQWYEEQIAFYEAKLKNFG